MSRPREQRKSKRTHRRQAAWIVLDGGRKISCVLWDISDGGARIAAAHGNALPDVFGLFLTKDGKSRRFCQVVWRRGGQFGVRFVAEESANIDLDPAPAWMRRRQPQAIPTPKPTGPSHGVETIQLLLPGYVPDAALQGRRNTFRMSAAACGILMMLVGATVLFAIAHYMDDAEWAVAVCSNAESFCQHPEWTGAAGIAMFIIFLTLNGMED